MIPILKRDLAKIFGSTHTAEEFISGNGRPDLVFACASNEQSLWKRVPPDYQMLHLLIEYLNKAGRVIHVDEIFGTEVRSSKKIKPVLDKLSESGFIEFMDKDRFIVRKKYKPVANEFVSIEAKLRDWKSGVYQAVKYGAFSNCSYLAISAEYLDKVERRFLKERGIGLISVSSLSAKIIIQAKKHKPESIISHYYLSELLVNPSFSV